MSDKKQYRGGGRDGGQMFQKFNNIRRDIETRPFNNRRNGDFKDPSSSVDRWVKDGVDHINIWEKGNTELGKVLSPSVTIPFNHGLFGHFETMEGFWHYIHSAERDDRIRNMSGTSLKNFARKLSPTRVKHFKALIIDANYQKIKKYKQVVESLKESSLPFDAYYTNNVGLRIRHNYSVWLCAGFEEIRKALKEDRDPDLSSFMDNDAPQSEIYDGVIPEYLRKSRQADAETEQQANDEEKPKVPSLLARVKEEVAEQRPETPEPTVDSVTANTDVLENIVPCAENVGDTADTLATAKPDQYAVNDLVVNTQTVVVDPETGAVVTDGFVNTAVIS